MALVKKKRIDTASASRNADTGEDAVTLPNDATLPGPPDNALSTRRAAEVRRRTRAGNRRRKAAEGIAAASNELASGVTQAAAAAEELRKAMEQVAAGAEEAASATQQSDRKSVV